MAYVCGNPYRLSASRLTQYHGDLFTASRDLRSGVKPEKIIPAINRIKGSTALENSAIYRNLCELVSNHNIDPSVKELAIKTLGEYAKNAAPCARKSEVTNLLKDLLENEYLTISNTTRKIAQDTLNSITKPQSNMP